MDGGQKRLRSTAPRPRVAQLLEREILGSASTNYFKWLYFSVRGRIGRQAYWLFMILPCFLTGIMLGFLIPALHIPIRMVLVLLFILARSGQAVEPEGSIPPLQKMPDRADEGLILGKSSALIDRVLYSLPPLLPQGHASRAESRS